MKKRMKNQYIKVHLLLLVSLAACRVTDVFADVQLYPVYTQEDYDYAMASLPNQTQAEAIFEIYVPIIVSSEIWNYPATVTSITIRKMGTNSVTLTSNGGNFRFITNKPGVTLTISGLTIDGFSYDYMGGGAILNQGILNLNNVVLSNNTIRDYYGGAIYNSGGTINANDVTFTDNKNSGTMLYGGAISIYGGSANLNGVTFSTNGTGTTNGGAIYAYAAAITCYNTIRFYDNTASYGGGALLIESNSNLKVKTGSSVVFSGNTAGSLGSDVFNMGAIAVEGGGSFSANPYTSGYYTPNAADYSNYNITVNSFDPGVDADPLTNTLQEAVDFANSNPNSPVLIKFAPGIGNLSNPISVSAELQIEARTEYLTIDGGVGVILTSDTPKGHRCFNKKDNSLLELKNITIDGFDYAGYGAAMFNVGGFLILDNVKFSNNSTAWGTIHAEWGIYTIRNQIIFENNQNDPVMSSNGAAGKSFETVSGKISFSDNTGTLWNDNFYNLFIKSQITGTLNTYVVTTNADDNSEGSLKSALAKANATDATKVDTIRFAGPMKITTSTGYGFVMSSSQDPTVRGKSLVIDGSCNVVIKSKEGTSNYRAFWNNIKTDTLFLKGLTIRDFNCEGFGASIFNNASCNLVLDNIDFVNNVYTGEESGGAGGAVASVDGSLVIFRHRVFFENNSATKTAGGALFLGNARLVVETGAKGIFLNNTSLRGGGAIYSAGVFNDAAKSLYAIATGSSLVFTGNEVLKYEPLTDQSVPAGGAILHAGNSKIDLQSSIFNSNKAFTGGGFCATDASSGATVKLYGCTFSNNEAYDPTIDRFKNTGGGGAINKSGPLFMDEKCVFTNNRASGAGGAIVYTNVPATLPAPEDWAPLKIKGVFRANQSVNDGGAISVVTKEGSPGVHIYGNVGNTHCVYEKNYTKEGAGGFISVSNSPINIYSNDPQNPTTSSDSTFYRIYFMENRAARAGGVIYGYNNQTYTSNYWPGTGATNPNGINISRARFINNKQQHEDLDVQGLGGGAIAFQGHTKESQTVTMNDTVPTILTVTNSYFETNSAFQGGAIASFYPGVQDQDGSNYTGGDRVIIDGTTVTKDNLTIFYGNRASWIPDDNKYGNGGAIFTLGNIQISAKEIPLPLNRDPAAIPQFYGNKAEANGGAIYCSGNITLDKVAFQGNTSYSGGSLYLRLNTKNNAEVHNSRFTGNSAGWGGAICMENLKLNGEEFENIPTGDVRTTNTIYLQNGASSGGAIYANMPGSVDVYACIFDQNKAVGDTTYNADGTRKPIPGDPKSGGSGGAIFSLGGSFNIGKDGTANANIFKNNYATEGSGTGAAILTSGVAVIQNSKFEGNIAGYTEKIFDENEKVAGYKTVPGHIIAFGNNDLTQIEKVSNNEIIDSYGNINNLYFDAGQPENPVTNPQTLYLKSNAIGYHKGYQFDYPDDKSKWIVGNTEISENTISGNHFGVVIDSFVVGTEITRNRYVNNDRAIYTGQHIPRLAAKTDFLPRFGNLGVGMPLVYSITPNEDGTKLTVRATVSPGLTTDATDAKKSFIELYKSDKELDDQADLTYLGQILMNENTVCGTTIEGEITLPGNVTFNPASDKMLALTMTAPMTVEYTYEPGKTTTINTANNTSELYGQAIKLRVNVTNPADSPINWNDATFLGTWDDAGYYAEGTDGSVVYNDYTGCEKLEGSATGASQVIYLSPEDTSKWEMALKTSDGKRFGAWSFNGLKGDTINLETYRVAQNYDFDHASSMGSRFDDYKLLAAVDGSSLNPFRNNNYLSVGNADGNTGGGGGLLIKKNSLDQTNGSVFLNSSVIPVGSSIAGALTAGFVVIDKDADFIVDNSSSLNMTNVSSNGTSVYGPRLLIEKDFETCGIFSLQNGGSLQTSTDNFMAAYHHVLSVSQWSWLSFPEAQSIAVNQPLKNMLYTTSASSEQFTSSTTSTSGPNLRIYAYSESARATTAPSFGSNGSAWNTTGSDIRGYIANIKNDQHYKDLYLKIEDPTGAFGNASVLSADVSFTKCTRLDQYRAAAYYQEEAVPGSIDEAGPKTQKMVASYHSGWNLIGNPYSTSYIPDENMGVVAMPTPDGKNYTYCNLDGIILGTSYNNAWSYYPGTENNEGFRIPPLTAFVVQAPPKDGSFESWTGTMNITGSSSLDNTLLRSSRPEPGVIRIDLLKNDWMVSQAVLSFSQGATPVSDWGLDAPLMATTGQDVYLPDKMGTAMAINVMGEDSREFSTPIGLNLNQTGSYAFRISEVKNIESELVLKDGETETLVQEGDTYLFTTDTQGRLETRFSIAGQKINSGIPVPDKQNMPWITVSGGMLTASNLTGNAIVELFDITGNICYRGKTLENTYRFPVPVPGNYIVRIIQEKQVYTQKITY